MSLTGGLILLILRFGHKHTPIQMWLVKKYISNAFRKKRNETIMWSAVLYCISCSSTMYQIVCDTALPTIYGVRVMLWLRLTWITFYLCFFSTSIQCNFTHMHGVMVWGHDPKSNALTCTISQMNAPFGTKKLVQDKPEFLNIIVSTKSIQLKLNMCSGSLCVVSG